MSLIATCSTRWIDGPDPAPVTRATPGNNVAILSYDSGSDSGERLVNGADVSCVNYQLLKQRGIRYRVSEHISSGTPIALMLWNFALLIQLPTLYLSCTDGCLLDMATRCGLAQLHSVKMLQDVAAREQQDSRCLCRGQEGKGPSLTVRPPSVVNYHILFSTILHNLLSTLTS